MASFVSCFQNVGAGRRVQTMNHAFDRESGRQLWVHPAGRGVLGAVVGSGTRVFAYTATGDLIALNLASGKPEWTHALKASAWESPAAIGARVFAGSDDGSVYAFNAETGRVEWQQKLGPAIGTSIRATESAVYAGTADGKMHGLAPSTGEVQSSLSLDAVLTPGTAPLITRDAVLVLLTSKQADYKALLSLDPALGRVNGVVRLPTVGAHHEYLQRKERFFSARLRAKSQPSVRRMDLRHGRTSCRRQRSAPLEERMTRSSSGRHRARSMRFAPHACACRSNGDEP